MARVLSRIYEAMSRFRKSNGFHPLPFELGEFYYWCDLYEIDKPWKMHLWEALLTVDEVYRGILRTERRG